MAKSKLKRGDRITYRGQHTPGTIRRSAHGEYFITWDDGDEFHAQGFQEDELELIEE